MRMYQQNELNTSAHPMTFTSNQQKWLSAAWDYANMADGHGSTQDVILGVSCALWAPETVDHICTNTFDDAVIQYAIYSNLDEHGAFEDPNVISSALARIKNVMRLSTLYWALKTQKENQYPVSW